MCIWKWQKNPKAATLIYPFSKIHERKPLEKPTLEFTKRTTSHLGTNIKNEEHPMNKYNLKKHLKVIKLKSSITIKTI